MKRIFYFLAILILLTLPAYGEATLSESGDFSGRAVLSFLGTSVTATFTGGISLSGMLTDCGESILFTASGTIGGIAAGDSETLAGIAWATLTARGTLQTGEAIDIRGGFTIDSKDLSSISGTAGAGTGNCCLVIRTRGMMLKLTGHVEGSATGSFVIPEDPYTMEVAGSGTMRFEATSLTSPKEDVPSALEEEEGPLPWNLSTWPEEMSSRLLHLIEEHSPE